MNTKLVMASVYDARIAAGAPDEKARSAAEDVASYENRFNELERKVDRLDGRVTLLQWMVGVNTALVIAVEARIFTLNLN